VPVTITIPASSGRITQLSLSGGSPLSCNALTTSGDLFAWGYNNVSALGLGDDANPLVVTKSATDVLSIVSRSMTIPTNYEFHTQTIIQKADGYYSAGYNKYGECGVGSTTTTINRYTKMNFPEGTIIQHIGKNVATNNSGNWIAVDQYGKWYGWGYGVKSSLSNQRGTVSYDEYKSPFRMNPYNLLWARGWSTS